MTTINYLPSCVCQRRIYGSFPYLLSADGPLNGEKLYYQDQILKQHNELFNLMAKMSKIKVTNLLPQLFEGCYVFQ